MDQLRRRRVPGFTGAKPGQILIQSKANEDYISNAREDLKIKAGAGVPTKTLLIEQD
jgi:hypothetical protein